MQVETQDKRDGNQSPPQAGGAPGACKGVANGFFSSFSANMVSGGMEGGDIGEQMALGAIGGGSVGAANVGLHGVAIYGPPTEFEEAALQDYLQRYNMSRPDFRTGGLYNAIRQDCRAIDCGVYSRTTGKVYMGYSGCEGLTYVHETEHRRQEVKLGYSRMCERWKEENDLHLNLPGIDRRTLEGRARAAESHYMDRRIMWDLYKRFF